MKRLPIFALCLFMFSLVVADDEQKKFERISEDDSIPADATRIDFDQDADGAATVPRTDISKAYVRLGCKFESSFKDSVIAIQPYNVGGRSGGRCAANLQPLYQGQMTIRFCKPGDADMPATVRMVGFWTSHIAPRGTSLEAYDLDDRLIGKIETTRPERDFLAIKSEVPIAYIKVVPDLEVDPDYAIDDLVFDQPAAVMMK